MHYSQKSKQLLARTTVALGLLFVGHSANAAILDLGNITRDTATGLDWLDVTETRGRSYNDVQANLGAGGDLAGWRFATVNESKDFISAYFSKNYEDRCVVENWSCTNSQAIEADTYEEIIGLFGDTLIAHINESPDQWLFATPTGYGGLNGYLQSYTDGGNTFIPSYFIGDFEYLAKSSDGQEEYIFDGDDMAYWGATCTVGGCATPDYPNWNNPQYGSFLVRETSAVPVPAAGWLFMSALVSLVGKKRLFRR